MQLKRYRSTSVGEALDLARAELGPQALVLSTRLVAARGWRGWMGRRQVEVTAAVDLGMSESRPALEPARPLELPEEPLMAPTPSLAKWQEGLVARLCATGLDRELAADVAGAFPRWRRRDVSIDSLRHALSDQLADLATVGDLGSGIDVFVGPPGVGKTTTIAKIAARRRVHDGTRVTLVAADGYRVGAVEQLRLYADIIGAPFVVARTAGDLAGAIQDAAGPTLVDTAGRSPRDEEFARLVAAVTGRPNVRTHLVLPASLARREAERALNLFAGAAPRRVVLTRVDETESIAPLVGLLRERSLRVTYLGTGQRVPEDLEIGTADTLAARVLGETPSETGAPS